jgi:hypothetical protein
MFIAAAYVVYLGPFNIFYRKKVQDYLVRQLIKL